MLYADPCGWRCGRLVRQCVGGLDSSYSGGGRQDDIHGETTVLHQHVSRCALKDAECEDEVMGVKDQYV